MVGSLPCVVHDRKITRALPGTVLAGRSKYGQAVSNSTSETSHTTTFGHVENRSQSKLPYTHWKFLAAVPTKVERTDGRQVCRPFRLLLRLGMCPWGVACTSVCFACGKPHAGGKRCRRCRWELASWLASRAAGVRVASRAWTCPCGALTCAHTCRRFHTGADATCPAPAGWVAPALCG